MNRAKFFDTIRHTLFNGKLSVEQVQGTEALLNAFEAAKWPLSHAAYALATAKHETAHTMQPIREYGLGRGKKYGVKGKHGQIAYGRGYVQLTWDYNYQNADEKLGLNGALISNYDLALRPSIAASIMVRGMAEGWFTGKKNRDTLDKTPPDYRNARKIINSLDDAELIAGYARKFAIALEAAGYGKTAPAPPPEPAKPPPVVEPPRHDGKHESPPGFLSRFFSALKERLSK
jgi:putative chitinase